jgi:urease accessory protein
MQGSHPARAAALLLLADGRFPAGAHAHSAGVEAAIADGRILGEADLEAFIVGRLRTAGLVEAALAAATVRRLGCRPAPEPAGELLRDLDAQADARIAAPPLREASRRLGRQLLRVAAGCWPSPVFAVAGELFPDGAHAPLALGLVGVAVGLSHKDVAGLTVHNAVTTPAQAAVRLLGLDPFAVAALSVRLLETGQSVVAEAVAATSRPLDELPARAGPLLDLAALEHAGRELRMFAT